MPSDALAAMVRASLATLAAPVRTVGASDHGFGMGGLLFCEKGGGRCDTESLGEFRLAVAMRDDQAVSAFRCQPETFLWTDRDSAPRRYTPDFVVLLAAGGLVYREVKTSQEYHDNPTLDGRRDDIVVLCRRRGASFEIWTDAGRERGRVGGPMTCRIALR